MANNHDFQAGDVVVLKSGGPEMTIIDVGPGHYTCRWYEKGSQTMQTEEFPSASIMKPPKKRTSLRVRG